MELILFILDIIGSNIALSVKMLMDFLKIM